jgi:iron complex transport system substrate-binding protein
VAGPGTVIDDAMRLLGIENMAAGAKMAYPKYSLEEVIHQSPDALLIGSATGMDMRKVSQGFLKRLTNVPAVKKGAICYTGDKLYRLGPRVIKGIEELAACLK